MDSSPTNSLGNESDRSEYARRLGQRVGVNFGPVFDSVSYLMGRYCKSTYSLARCLEALNSDEKMRKKIAREIWYHYTHGVLVYDKLGVDLDEYNEDGKAYTSSDEDGNKVPTRDKGAFVRNDSDTVSNDDDDVETITIKTDGEAAVGLTDDECLISAVATSFGDDGSDGDRVRNDDNDIDADSDNSADGAHDDVDDVDTEGDDGDDDDDDDDTEGDATVQSVDTDSDDVDNADDDATVQSVDTDIGYVNDDDVDNTDDDVTVQSVDTDGDDVNNNKNNEDDEDSTVQSDDDSTVPSDYDDVVVGSSNGGDNSNRRDSTGSSSPSDENVYIADCDENRDNSSGDDSANVPSEDNDSVSNGNFEELGSPNSYEEDGDVNDDADDVFIPSDEVVPPSSCEDNGSEGPPFKNGEINTSDSDEFVTTSDEDDDDHNYITSDPIDNFLGTLQEQCMWLYKRGLGEGDGKFKSDPIRRRARLKKIADFYFAEKMDGYYPRIKYQKPTYQNGYEFGLTDYLQRLGKRLGVEFGPVFEGCAIKMGRYLRSTRTLQRCVDIINNDEEMRRGLARSVWHHFIEGIVQKIR